MRSVRKRVHAVRFLLGAVVAASLGLGAAVAAEETVTNQTILDMQKLGFSEAVLVEKIRGSRCEFDTSTAALGALKKEGVPDAVLAEMLRAGRPAATGGAPPAPAASDPNDPMAEHPSGIYHEDRGAQGVTLLRIAPSASVQQKVGGMWKSALSFGAAKVKARAILQGEHADMQIAERRPTFYFYFGKEAESFGGASPEQFALVRARLNDGNRELVVATASITGMEAGALEKFAVDFEVTELRTGAFKVVPKVDLEDAEYAFFYGTQESTSAMGGSAAGKIFAFGVNEAAQAAR